MSASPMARQVTETKSIPTKRVQFNNFSELPSNYSSTPGGTLYSTTPGGTKIVYEKTVLMNLRNSPISKTPPSFDIPNALVKGKACSPLHTNNNKNRACNFRKAPPKPAATDYKSHHDEDQFQIEL